MAVGTLNVWAIDQVSESAYGTSPALVTGAIATGKAKRHLFNGERPAIRVETASDEQALSGVMEQGFTQVVAKKWMEASYEFDLKLDALATYLKFALGSYAVTGTGSYTHTFTVNQGDTPSFTGYWKEEDTASGKLEAFTGIKVRRLTVRGTGGGKCSFSVELVGSGVHSEVTCATPSLSAPTDVQLPFASINTFTIGGTNYKSNLLSFEVTFENVYDDSNEFAAGSTTLQGLERTGFRVTGRIELAHNANALTGLIADVEAQTARAIVLDIRSSASNLLTINVYNAYLEGTETNGQISKVKHTLTFKGMYSTSSSKACDVTITNSTATYS